MKTTLLVSLLLSACSSAPRGPTPDPQPTNPPNEEVTFSSDTSVCGGFTTSTMANDTIRDLQLTDDYCAAERLYWNYDARKRELTLVNTRVPLNCCGQRTVTAAIESKTLVVSELVVPNGRLCDCDCVFDYSVVAVNLPQDALSVTIVRSGDSYSAQQTWSGTIDVSQLSGVIVLDPTSFGSCSKK